MNIKLLGSLAVVTAAVLWSFDGLLRQHLFDLPATVIVFWEHVLGAVILLPVIFFRKKLLQGFTKKQWKALAVVALLSGALGTIFFTTALAKISFIPFSVVILLQQLQPLFAIVTSALLLKEPLTKRFLFLAIIAIVAAYFVSFPTLTVNIENNWETLVAALFAIGAAASWGTSTALSKYALNNTSVIATTAVRFFFGAMFALVFVALLGNTNELTAVEPHHWKYLAAITGSTGLVALAIYYYGLQKILASRATILELAWPLSGVVFGYVVFGDVLTPTQWIGATVLLFIMVHLTKHEIQKTPQDQQHS